MKYHHDGYNFERNKARQLRGEDKAGGFRCSHCKLWVLFDPFMGTTNRNHCNVCLWSKHVDEKKGDRRASCNGGMRPIGLTFKNEGIGKQGELMLVHECCSCSKTSINRVARDDIENNIVDVFNMSLRSDTELQARLDEESIYLLRDTDAQEVHIQLFGKY